MTACNVTSQHDARGGILGYSPVMCAPSDEPAAAGKEAVGRAFPTSNCNAVAADFSCKDVKGYLGRAGMVLSYIAATPEGNSGQD